MKTKIPLIDEAGTLLCPDCDHSELHVVDVNKSKDRFPDLTIKLFCEACGCANIKNLRMTQHKGVTLLEWGASLTEENHTCAWCVCSECGRPHQVEKKAEP